MKDNKATPRDSDLLSKAERLYILFDASYEEIAAQVGRSLRTISRWAEDGKWKERKAAEKSRPEELCKALLEANLNIIEMARAEGRNITAAEADTIFKNNKGIAVFKKDVSLLSATAVFKRYNAWLVELSPELAKQNTEFMRKFLMVLVDEQN